MKKVKYSYVCKTVKIIVKKITMKFKGLIFITFLLFLTNNIKAQDFDVYPRMKDDNVNMPNLYENTLFDEYQILARNVRMMDMVYSAVVPGYIHFKAKEYSTGYGLVAARLLGYSGLAINYLNMNKQGLNLGDIPNLGAEYNFDKYVFYSSITLIISSYLFDWIHGKYKLEKKQELIRYKYGIKLKMDNLTYNHSSNLTPCFSLTYNF